MGDHGHNIIPFGRTEPERLANLKRALADAETAAAARRHPSVGPWASTRRLTEEERRAQRIAAKPHCKSCAVLLNPRYPPRDELCPDCRADMRDNGPPDVDPGLF